jgi:hypothetical protein
MVRAVTFNWDATDAHAGVGAHELWKAGYVSGTCDENNKDGCFWNMVSSKTGSEATDSPSYGAFWYSLRLFDQSLPSGNCITTEAAHCGGVAHDSVTRSPVGPVWVQVPVIGGLVPCGRALNAIDTPWDETEDCEFRHLFLLLWNVINFLIWQLVPLIIVLMVVLTGVVMYFQFGGPGTLVWVKRAWRYIGIGVLTLLFSWLFLNFFLGILGFDINIF